MFGGGGRNYHVKYEVIQKVEKPTEIAGAGKPDSGIAAGGSKNTAASPTSLGSTSTEYVAPAYSEEPKSPLRSRDRAVRRH